MINEFLTVAGADVVQKLIGQNAGYALDFSQHIAPGDYIVGAAWTVDNASPSAASPTLPSAAFGWTTTTASIRLGSGGTVGWHLVQCSAATNGGDVLDQEFRVYVQDFTVLGAGIVSAFPSLAAAVASLRRDRLAIAVMNLLPEVTIQDDYLLEKLVASEANIQRQLRVYLTPREILPMGGAMPGEEAALVGAGNTVEWEPGYDYDPSMFQGNTWGLIEVRQKPIIEVHSIVFDYPAPDNQLFTIPTDWVRADKKYGRINLVPVQTAISLPLNVYILAALGGGRTVPFMLQVRYRCGLRNCAKDYPDILDIIKKEAVLSLVEDQLVPASTSDSADGLSQSISFQAEKYPEIIGRKTETLRQSIHGIRLMVV